MPDVQQLFRACRQGDKQACRTLVDIFWFGPIFARELKKLMGPVAIVPIPHPWPGPEQAPMLDTHFLREGDWIRLATGDPHPQPSSISVAEQLKAAIEFRGALDQGIKAIDHEINRLQNQ